MPNVPELRFPEFSGEWVEKRLGEICKTFSGGTPDTTNKVYWNGHIPFIKSGEINNKTTSQKISELGLEYSSAKLIKKGDLLLALYGATSGEVAISKLSGAINQAILCIRCKKAEETFLYYFLFYKKNKIISKYTQGGQPNLSAKIIKNLKILIPPTLTEQQKIASFLSNVDEKIELQEQKIEQFEKYKKALLQKLFATKDKKVPKLRFPEFSGEWGEKKLGEVGNIITGTTPSTKIKSYYENGIYPWVTPTDITDNKNIYETERKLTKEGLKQGRLIPKNSLLVTCIASIGKNAILRKDGSCNQQINAIIPFKEYDTDFLYYKLETMKNKLLALAGQTATPILNKTDFSKIKILIPPTLAEQQKIASFLSSIDEKIELEKEKLDKIKAYKKALLQKMFV